MQAASNQKWISFKENGLGTMAEAQAAVNLDTLHHVAAAVSDVKGTVDWYTRHFDCRVAYQDATWALVQFSNVSLAFVPEQLHRTSRSSAIRLLTATRKGIVTGQDRSTCRIPPEITWKSSRWNKVSRAGALNICFFFRVPLAVRQANSREHQNAAQNLRPGQRLGEKKRGHHSSQRTLRKQAH